MADQGSFTLDPNDNANAAEFIQQSPAPDAAQRLSELEPEHAAEVTAQMNAEQLSPVIAHLDSDRAAEILSDMTTEKAVDVLAGMAPDDRVDILGHFSEEMHDRLVQQMEPADRREVEQLEQFEPDTAGGIMTTDVTSLYEHLTVADAIEQLRRLSEEREQMFYVYVIDRRAHLVGILSMRDLILSKPERLLHEIMREDVASVPADMDQEEVARLMRRYSYLAMPVVDKMQRLIGLITIDDVSDVIEEENTEDIHKLFGAGAEERLTSPWTLSFRRRLPWLLVNLVTASVAGSVVAAFDGTIARMAVLAAFMPIVAGMGGNASAQAMAVAVRGMVLNEVDFKLIVRVLRRETFVGFLNGAIIGAVAGTLACTYYYLGYGGTLSSSIVLGLVVGAALQINHTIAPLTGAGVPFIMRRLGFDPAQSATIFATTTTDIVGFFSLLSLAYLAMNQLIGSGGM